MQLPARSNLELEQQCFSVRCQIKILHFSRHTNSEVTCHHHSVRATTGNVAVDRHNGVLVKLYLQKQVAGGLYFINPWKAGL
jgi:hypothetical protein